jgi:hypothetical protein
MPRLDASRVSPRERFSDAYFNKGMLARLRDLQQLICGRGVLSTQLVVSWSSSTWHAGILLSCRTCSESCRCGRGNPGGTCWCAACTPLPVTAHITRIVAVAVSASASYWMITVVTADRSQ